MAAYLIVYREGPIKDPAEMAEYQRKTRLMTGHKLKPLAVYGAVHPLEGKAPDGVILVEFASVEEAKAWYEDPAYQDALRQRQKAADYRLVIVEGM